MLQQLELETQSYRPRLVEAGEILTPDQEYEGLVNTLVSLGAVQSEPRYRTGFRHEGRWAGSSRHIDISPWNSLLLGDLRIIAPDSPEEPLSYVVVDGSSRSEKHDRSAAYASSGQTEDEQRVLRIAKDISVISSSADVRVFHDPDSGTIGMYNPRTWISRPPIKMGEDYIYGVAFRPRVTPGHAMQGEVFFLVGDPALHPERFGNFSQEARPRLAIDTTVSTVRLAIAEQSTSRSTRENPSGVGVTYGTDWSQSKPGERTQYKLRYDLYPQEGLIRRVGPGIEFRQFANLSGEPTHPTKSSRRALWTLTVDQKPVEPTDNMDQPQVVLDALQRIAASYGTTTNTYAVVSENGVLIRGPRADILLRPNNHPSDKTVHGIVEVTEHPKQRLRAPQE